MILLEIDAIRIAVDEFECYAPRTVDVDRVTLAAFQGVEVIIDRAALVPICAL